MALNSEQKKDIYDLQEKILNFIESSGRYVTKFRYYSLYVDLLRFFPSKSTYISIGFFVVSSIILSFRNNNLYIILCAFFVFILTLGLLITKLVIRLLDTVNHTKILQEDRLDRLRIIRWREENTSDYSYKSFYKFLEPNVNDLVEPNVNDLVSCPAGEEKSFVLNLMKNKAKNNLTDFENQYKFAPYLGTIFGLPITAVVLSDILKTGKVIMEKKGEPFMNPVFPIIFLIASTGCICLFLYLFSIDAKKWRDITHILEDISF
jgi:hypothetical protein